MRLASCFKNAFDTVAAQIDFRRVSAAKATGPLPDGPAFERRPSYICFSHQPVEMGIGASLVASAAIYSARGTSIFYRKHYFQVLLVLRSPDGITRALIRQSRPIVSAGILLPGDGLDRRLNHSLAFGYPRRNKRRDFYFAESAFAAPTKRPVHNPNE